MCHGSDNYFGKLFFVFSYRMNGLEDGRWVIRWWWVGGRGLDWMVEWWGGEEGGWEETRVCGGREGKLVRGLMEGTNLISTTHLGMSFSQTGTSSR